MDIFEVGCFVRHIETGRIGEVYAVRNGVASGRRIYSVKFEVPGKNRSHGFYYTEEIEAVDDE